MNDCPESENQTESNESRPPDQLGFFVQSESLDSMRKSWHSKFAFFAHFALLLFGVGVAHAQIGGFDPSFITGPILSAGTNASVRAMAVQTNGYVIVAGDFTSIGGAQRNRIARLTSTGALDASFNPQSGADGPIHAVVLQSDGKILIGGEFTTYNGVSRNRIARLTSNGSLDTTFDPGIGANGTVRAIALNSSSYYFNGYGASILIGGDFTSVGGATRNRIAQLSATGALDTSFNPGSGANDTVYAIVVSGNYYPSGIYVGGAFTSFNGQTRNRLVKLNAYGSVDYSFNSGVGLDGAVYALALLGDTYSSSAGLYAGGNFTSVDGVVRGRIARFTVSSYGFGSSIDQNFNVWTDAPVRAFVTEGDSYSRQAKILIAGDFTLVNGVSKNRLARLLVGSDYYYGPFGSSAYANLDTTFNPSPGINNSVFASAKLPDGRTLIGGAFDQVSGNSTSGLTRLYGDFGSSLPGNLSSLGASPASSTQMILDWSSATNASGYKIERSSDGVTDWTQIGSSGSPYVDNGLSSGTTYFYRIRASNYNGDGPYSSIVNAATDSSAWTGPGSLDPSTGPNSGPNSTVNAIVRQSDGKIVVVGSFSQVAGVARKYIARLNADWTLDTDFDPGTGPNSSIKAVAVQADGKILIGGDFSTVNGVTRKYIARLTNTGSLDVTFDPGIGPNSSVEAINIQADGKSLVGGWFSNFSGYSQEYIARLNTDGSLDMEYRTTANSIVYSIEIQSDGRAIIGGSFSTVNGISKTGIARINMDGSLDLTFNNGTGAMSVKDLFIQIDGKILLCGGFSTFNGVSRKYVARLDSSGALDTTFDPGTGPNSSLECVSVDAQGKVVIGGYFTNFSASNRFRIARLNIDGTLDATFRPGIGMNSVINSILIQPDTKIVVGGSFTTIGGVTANYLARLNGGVNGQLMITSVSPMATGTAGTAYSQDFEASGGTPPYSWSITSGPLPPGITLDSSGILYGKPKLTISSSFLLRVTDSTLQYSERRFDLSTVDIPSGLVILEATYGANGTTADVRSYVSAKIMNNTVNMSASNSNLGGDPISGKVKTLYVRYQDTTGHYETSIQEGGTLMLSNTSHHRLPMSYTQWSSTKFSSGEVGDSEISGPVADADGDGFCNLLESAFGGNPKASDVIALSPSLSFLEDKLQITFICDSNRSDLTYSVEASNDLTSWNAEIARSVSGATTIPLNNLSIVSDSGLERRFVTVTDNAGIPSNGRRFLRIKIKSP